MLISFARPLYAASPRCSIPIDGSSTLLPVTVAKLACSTTSIWRVSFEAFRKKMQSIWLCYSKLKVSLFDQPAISCADWPAFNEFIHERESTRGEDPSIKLFDEIVLSKKNRSRTSIFSKSSQLLSRRFSTQRLNRAAAISFLSDTSDHLWRSAVAAPPNSRFPGNYRSVVTRSEFYLFLLCTLDALWLT